MREYQVKDPLLLQYYHLVTNMMATFVEVRLEHIPLKENKRVNVMSKLGSIKKKGKYKSLLQQVLVSPSTKTIEDCMAIYGAEADYMTPCVKYLKTKDATEEEGKD